MPQALTLRQKQKIEALERMKILKLDNSVIKDFNTKGTIYLSERQNKIFQATLYWVSNYEDYVAIIDEFEKKYNSIVYHCQLTHTTFGDLLSLLYVSDTEEEWAMDKNDLRNNCAVVRVENLQDKYSSEFGTIGLKSVMGGVVRTA